MINIGVIQQEEAITEEEMLDVLAQEEFQFLLIEGVLTIGDTLMVEEFA